MPELTLGLDLGPSSIGWALLDESSKRIVVAGVRVFPEGVDRDQQGGEKSKTQTRRDARGARRQIARRAARKKHLRHLLTSKGLLPKHDQELERVLGADPYDLRRRALDERVTPHEVGRVLLHLGQRRGFLSNRKTDRQKASEAKGMLAEISELAGAISDSGHRTLGEHLAELHSDPHERIRNRHTQRSMYVEEFEAVWSAQQAHHPKILTDALKKELYDSSSDDTWIHKGLIFGQRQMKWPRSMVGRCEYELKAKRCEKADRHAQQFRILQEVNNLSLLDRSTGEERRLTPEERGSLVEYLGNTRQRTFDQIRKKLGFTESTRFNLERGERDKLKGGETDALLGGKNGVGPRWKKLPDEERDAIVDVLINEDQEHVALERLTREYGLELEEARRALKVNLPQGHTNVSRLAIDKLIPHLKRGLFLMADDETNSALHAAGYLRPDERAVGQREFLPGAPDLPNPIVRQALVEVRKVVNAVIREFGKPARIHIELAREAKKSFEQRQEIRFEIARRRKEREGVRQELEEYDPSIKPTLNTLRKYQLWREQSETCVYCGRKISQAQLFDGSTDVDHILPRWRSLDNSMANKVICHRACNADKGDRTPREWLEDADPQRYAEVLRVAELLPYNKQRKFQLKDIVLDEFVARQLRDTAYISRCVTQYLRCLGSPIACPRGQMTAELRHWWGLNRILDSEGRGEKNRADHRHHAIDAVVIALTYPKRLHALANARGKNMPTPWARFHEDIRRTIEQIQVSHRSQRRLYGALHEATLYGATQLNDSPAQGATRPWARDWIEDERTFVRRKPVTEITNAKHMGKVRDATIRAVLEQHLRTQGIDPAKAGKLPGDAFKGENTPRMPSGVPIKRVRMLEESETFRRVSDRRAYHYVKPGNNHHIRYFARTDGKSERWVAEVVTMWDAARRARNGEPIVLRTNEHGDRFVMSLAIGEMFEIDDGDGERVLCVVRKIDQRSKGMNYKLHTDARPSGEINKDNLYLSPSGMMKLNGRKVAVDTIGRIRSAND